MGCSRWKTAKFKVVSCHTRNEDSRAWLTEGDNQPPSAEQLLVRIGQLKLDRTGCSSDRNERPNGFSPSGLLGTLFQAVIL